MSFLLNVAAMLSSDEDIEQFSRVNISYEAACDIAFSDDSFSEYATEFNFIPPEHTAVSVAANISDVAYHLANSHPTEASQLFEELLYYRNKGRI